MVSYDHTRQGIKTPGREVVGNPDGLSQVSGPSSCFTPAGGAWDPWVIWSKEGRTEGARDKKRECRNGPERIQRPL